MCLEIPRAKKSKGTTEKHASPHIKTFIKLHCDNAVGRKTKK